MEEMKYPASTSAYGSLVMAIALIFKDLAEISDEAACSSAYLDSGTQTTTTGNILVRLGGSEFTSREFFSSS